MKFNKKSNSPFWKIKTIAFCLLIFSFNSFGQSENKMPTDFPTLKKISQEELETKTQAHDKLWGISKIDRWDLDQDKGKLIFSLADGIKAEASAQIIGTYNSKDGTWLWAWANSSVDDALKKDALKVRQYGEEHRIEQLTKPKSVGKEEDAWAMAAIAMKLCGAQGVYRGPASSTLFVFISFGEVTVGKKK